MSSLHQHAKDLFLEALARPEAEREAFLSDACGTDLELRREVESLLGFHSASDSSIGLGSGGTAGPTDVDPEAFQPGEVFAGRYRMVARIGRGGMGDVWRADDLVLQTPVALKLMHLPGPAARQRILNEVRLARRITHPAVCRVFDVGEADGKVFFSMELVQGEDLASLLKRVGRLTADRVGDMARQLCGGLAAAHACGVLHRDLKPANVLIDDRGRVLITDFGIAAPRTEALRHTIIGTPRYMAPEQLVEGLPLTERTDLYALGVLLYELLTGQPPGEGEGVVAADLSSRLPHRDRALARVIVKALSPSPDARPASAAVMAARLDPRFAGESRRRGTLWLAGAAALVVIGIAAVTATYVLPVRPPALTARDTIVLANFENTTGEPVFDGALKVALAVAFEQSPFLRVFSDDRLEAALRLMGRSAETPVTRQIAREIAQRHQLKILVAGSIARLGRNYVIALEAINAQSGDAVARQQVEVTRQEDVLTALGRAASEMRGTLGESLASIQQFDTPLAQATTPSLEALNAYSLALDQGSANPRLEAIPHLKRAIELDPDFALALAFMATVYANNGQTALAPEFARKAFALRDRVSDRERFFIAFRYHRDATQDWDQALELTRAWTTSYPREAFAFNSLGTALLRFGRYEASLEPFTQAIQLDPPFAPAYGNLATARIGLNRFSEARQVLQQAADRQIESNGIRRQSYMLAFLDGDTAKTEQLWSTLSTSSDPTVHGWRAHTLAFAGRVSLAHDEFRIGIQNAVRSGSNEVAGQLAVEDAEAHAIVGQCAEARREVAEAVAWSRDNFTLERGARAAALCGADAEAARLTADLRERYPLATFTTRIALPLVTAAGALARHEPAQVLEALEIVRPLEAAQRGELWPAYLRGMAYLQLKDGRAAIDQLQSVIDRRGEDPDSQLFPLAHLGLAQAATMVGDTSRATAMSARFLALWKDADAGLPQLADAQRR